MVRPFLDKVVCCKNNRFKRNIKKVKKILTTIFNTKINLILKTFHFKIITCYIISILIVTKLVLIAKINTMNKQTLKKLTLKAMNLAVF